jgi:hypothetical protein
MTQTAIEWLFIQLYENFEMKGDGKEMNAILERAKEMEKEQTEAAYHDGVDDARNNSIKYGYYKDKKKNIHIERSPEWP